ncbi:MurR/RpiR family transcriptional regulator [Mesoplasma tabanidae]|uniref:HTH rpiR-type domain-containing protein n=1 Tax=Mesoplasma tabanidae TaxID=219745 RepID=A0A2K8P3Q8_9MOLU|nr:MurR/RpiR family transcriptional regulator [Mesoplasma tabanidae]ATZ21387.1 hypothetical protein MTABA_v1c01840 [Mesoplasma tabanidae]
MKSVFEQLENVAKSVEDSLFKGIAKTLLNNFMEGEFKNQEEISKECYVSISTITKFCKKIGYSGYRELIFNLKLEYARLGWQKASKNISTFDMLNSIQNWIISNDNFVEKIVKSIQHAQVINIYASYQVQHAAKYFVEILQELNKIAVLPRIEYRSTLQKNRETDLNLIILCSRNNDELIKFFEKQIHPSNQTFLIISEQQRHKISGDFTDEVIIDYQDSIPRGIYRNLALECLFMHILQVIKSSF